MRHLYNGGCIVNKINKYVKCLDCGEALLENYHKNCLPSMQFIALIDTGELTCPWTDLVNICLSAERFFQVNVRKNSSRINIVELTN